MRTPRDLSKEKFGKLKPIKLTGEKSKQGTYTWFCQCDCGNTKIVASNLLIHGKTTSCGCYRKEYKNKKQQEKLIGRKFNRLTIVSLKEIDKHQKCVWNCLCDCGNKTSAATSSLTTGHIKSCGCLNVENITKHGMHLTPEYDCWVSMKDRCYNPNHSSYPNYGGKNIPIKVCDDWLNSFQNFFKDMGYKPSPKHSIERIDSTKNYEPSNCTWILLSHQLRNTSRTKLNPDLVLRLREAHASGDNMSALCRKLGISKSTGQAAATRITWTDL